jgi:hypothetical protein
MSDDVRDFLIDLASDADRQARFKANPAKELALTKLNDEERGTVMSGDASRIRRLVNADDNGAPNLSAAKRKGTKKKGAKKKGGKKKGGRKSGRKK